jgi:ribosomal protein S18 acetylase RimI-like enzyme
MTLRVRRAAPSDYTSVGALTVRAYVDGGHLPPEADYQHLLADAETRAREAELWVAVEEDGAVLGSVTFAAPGSRYHEVAGPDEGDVRMLAVAGAAQGRGIGEALMRTCIDRGRELGLTALALSTQPSMRAAHRIYARLGFERTPARDWEPVPGVSLLAYRLDLSKDQPVAR